MHSVAIIMKLDKVRSNTDYKQYPLCGYNTSKYNLSNKVEQNHRFQEIRICTVCFDMHLIFIQHEKTGMIATLKMIRLSLEGSSEIQPVSLRPYPTRGPTQLYTQPNSRVYTLPNSRPYPARYPSPYPARG